MLLFSCFVSIFVSIVFPFSYMFWIIFLGPTLLQIEVLDQVHGNNSFSSYIPNYLKKVYYHYINYEAFT